MRSIAAILFPGFETLDLFGPVQMFGSVKGAFQFSMVAEQPGSVVSRHGQSVGVDHTFHDDRAYDLILVPGGPGTWEQFNNPLLLDWIRQVSRKAEVVMSVCTGAAFLANAGLLDGRSATTNKMNFHWVTQFGTDIDWKGSARWVVDGKFYTSSGVTAGMDMSLSVIEQLLSMDAADDAANHSEYVRQTDPDNDPFALHYLAT